MKGKKIEDGKGIGGEGRLTNARIDATQIFYGRNIYDNKGDTLKCLQKHGQYQVTTVEKPLRNDCPMGAKR